MKATGSLALYSEASKKLAGTCATKSGVPTLTVADRANDFFGTIDATMVLSARRTTVSKLTIALGEDSESIVRNLRDKNNPGGAEYRIPFGGGFRFVTSPAYLGELIAWSGFALLTWALPGVAILLITAGNLIPRALGTHTWYQEKFPEYPTDRKALLPYVL